MFWVIVCFMITVQKTVAQTETRCFGENGDVKIACGRKDINVTWATFRYNRDCDLSPDESFDCTPQETDITALVENTCNGYVECIISQRAMGCFNNMCEGVLLNQMDVLFECGAAFRTITTKKEINNCSDWVSPDGSTTLTTEGPDSTSLFSTSTKATDSTTHDSLSTVSLPDTSSILSVSTPQGHTDIDGQTTIVQTTENLFSGEPTAVSVSMTNDQSSSYGVAAEKQVEKKDSTVLYAALGAGGGLVLLILLIICVCCCCTSKRRKNASKEEVLLEDKANIPNGNAVSMMQIPGDVETANVLSEKTAVLKPVNTTNITANDAPGQAALAVDPPVTEDTDAGYDMYAPVNKTTSLKKPSAKVEQNDDADNYYAFSAQTKPAVPPKMPGIVPETTDSSLTNGDASENQNESQEMDTTETYEDFSSGQNNLQMPQTESYTSGDSKVEPKAPVNDYDTPIMPTDDSSPVSSADSNTIHVQTDDYAESYSKTAGDNIASRPSVRKTPQDTNDAEANEDFDYDYAEMSNGAGSVMSKTTQGMSGQKADDNERSSDYSDVEIQDKDNDIRSTKEVQEGSNNPDSTTVMIENEVYNA